MRTRKKGFGGQKSKKAPTKGEIKSENDAIMQQMQMISNITMQSMQSVRVLEQDFTHLVNNLRSFEVNEAAKLGDGVMIDFLGRIQTDEGLRLFEGGKGKGFVLELGSNMFIQGFEEQLVGSKAGDKLTVTVNFPENYNPENLSGKTAVFDVIVLKVVKDNFKTDIDDLEASYLAEQNPEVSEETELQPEA